MTTALFGEHLSVINVGLDGFATTISHSPGASATQLDWRPPANANAPLARELARLTACVAISAANAKAVAAFLSADPVLVDCAPASTVIAGLASSQRRLLHAGPPIEWDEMCGPMRGALIGATIAEGWAPSPEGAAALLTSGAIDLAPCHHHEAVGPMAGVVGPSMPVWIVEDATTARRSFSNVNEGLGAVLRFGAHGAEVLERLDWMQRELGPVLAAALRELGPLPLKPLIAQALHMGDEVHNRNVAATGQFLKRLAPALLRTDRPTMEIRRAIEFIAGNDHFFLNVSMAACKSMLRQASGITGSSLVTTMARNGVRFGIQMSATGDRWFEAPAQPVEGLYFPGYGPIDANPDLGDSAITETAGLGGFSMAAAPAIVQFVGGTPADAIAHTRRMYEITAATNPAFTIPALNFGQAPALIDVREVADTGIVPVINTGIAHRDAGVGQIGAGITTAPLACFTAALGALAEQIGGAPGGWPE